LGAVANHSSWFLGGGKTSGAALAVARLRWPQSRLPPRALCVLAIFKNETLNLREWVAHYRWQGASALLLLDNGGEAGEAGWRTELRGSEDFVTVLDAPMRHAQELQYNEIGRPWLEARGCEFAAVLDLDEFLYLRAPPTAQYSLRSAVAGAFDAAGASVAQLSCPWLIFGSSGLVAHPRGQVRVNFTWRAKEPHVLHKSIVRLSRLLKIKAHVHEASGDVMECPHEFVLNHYAIQSREYFEAVKMRRGDVCCKEYEGVRSWDYFRAFDSFELDDVALRDLVLQHSGRFLAPAN
jgi:hypothetical protein